MENDLWNLFSRMRKGSGLKFDTSGYWTYPALLCTQGEKLYWLSLILKTSPIPEKKRTALFRPCAMITTGVNSGIVVRYDDYLRGQDPFPDLEWDKPVAMFPHKGIADMTYEKFENKEKELMGKYETCAEQFSEDGTLPEDFCLLYIKLLHPIALPYLKALCPNFFSELKSKGIDNDNF